MPKKTTDHNTFRINCITNAQSDNLAFPYPDFLQTNHAATAIIRKRVDQTGPKIQLGGFQAGLLISAYQLLTLDVVAIDPTNAAAKQIAIETTSPIASLVVEIGDCAGGQVDSVIVELTFRTEFLNKTN